MKLRNGTVLTTIIVLAILLSSTAGCVTGPGAPANRTVLRVLPAGSLLLPFEEAEIAFEARHPEIDVQVEGHGSIQVIRQVTDLHRKVDVVAVADASLIPDLMFRQDPATGRNFTDSYTPFARNAMVIAYTNRSRYADQVTPENWYEILMRPDVRVGFSNPMLDAAGYRTIMVTLLASEYYHNATIFPVIIGSHFNTPLTVNRSREIQVVELPEIMRPSDEKLVIRDGSMYVLSLLESGGIDYAFEYRSVAQGHDLRYIELPRNRHQFDRPCRNVQYCRGDPRVPEVQYNRERSLRHSDRLCNHRAKYGTTPGICTGILRYDPFHDKGRGQRMACAILKVLKEM